MHIEHTKGEKYDLISLKSDIFDEEGAKKLREVAGRSGNHLIVEASAVSEFGSPETFEEISADIKKEKRSFVMVVKDHLLELFEDGPADAVPTMGEAEDYLEMEEIERKLGF